MTQRQRYITEFQYENAPGLYRLGRHVNHDERSKNFRARLVDKPKTFTHRNYGPRLNQNPVGACTGFAAAHFLNTRPYHKVGMPIYQNEDGWGFYSWATNNDPFEGVWTYPPPPGSGQDTGSDALSVCKGLKAKGIIKGYEWAFGYDELLRRLPLSPVMIGINWYEGFDKPNSVNGLVTFSGEIRGGHEFLVVGYDAKLKRVKCLNSWGEQWGQRGFFYFNEADLRRLIDDERGDCVVPS